MPLYLDDEDEDAIAHEVAALELEHSRALWRALAVTGLLAGFASTLVALVLVVAC